MELRRSNIYCSSKDKGLKGNQRLKGNYRKLRSDFISSLFNASRIYQICRLYTQIYHTKKPKLYKNIELTVAKVQNKCKRNIRLEKALKIR